MLTKEGKYHKLKKINGQAYLTVELIADINDGDYKVTKEIYVASEFEAILKELSNLKTNYAESRALKLFVDKANLVNIPYGDWGAAHTLEELNVTYTDEDGTIFEVDIKDSEKMLSCEYCINRDFKENLHQEVDDEGICYLCNDCLEE